MTSKEMREKNAKDLKKAWDKFIKERKKKNAEHRK